MFDLALAVAELIQTDSHPVQQREVEIGQRHAFLVLDVPATPHAGRRATRDENWKVLMVVDAGVVRIDLVSGNFVIDNKMHHE